MFRFAPDNFVFPIEFFGTLILCFASNAKLIGCLALTFLITENRT